MGQTKLQTALHYIPKGDTTCQRDFDLLDSNDSFGVTWSGGGWHEEAGAASHRKRILNLQAAKESGIQTWASCEPVISKPAAFLAIRFFDFVDLWRIGKLNHAKSSIDWRKFGHEVEALCQEFGRNYYIKEDLRADMNKEPAL